MPQLSLASWILVVVVMLFTATAAIWDFRQHRIPNKLTLPVFAAGWVFQLVFHSWAGLGNAALGFLVGFGVLFILWMVGGGGGGDVKLMGALSVWLGYRLTLLVLIGSTVTVILGTFLVVIWSVFTKGVRGMKSDYLANGKSSNGQPRAKTVEDKKRLRIMAYAIPVCVATWFVLAWRLPTLDGAAKLPPAPVTAPVLTEEAAS